MIDHPYLQKHGLRNAYLINKSFLLFLVSAFGVSLFGNSNFSRQTIDLGMVVSDIEKSVPFTNRWSGLRRSMVSR